MIALHITWNKADLKKLIMHGKRYTDVSFMYRQSS